MIRVLLVTIFLVGCATQKGQVLNWTSEIGQVTTYQGTIDNFPPDSELTISASELSKYYSSKSTHNNVNMGEIPSVFFKVADELTAVALPDDMPLVATVTNNSSNDLEVKLVGAPASTVADPQTEQAINELKMRKAKAGTIQLLAHMDNKGNVLSFYHFQKQKNLISLFFQLPDFRVNVGDSWNIPVQLIELGNGYIVDETQTFKRALLLAKSTNKQGETLAKILFIVHEFVKGNFQFKADDTLSAVPFSLDASYIGYGELVVNKGYWQQNIGQVAFVGTGQSPINVKKLHALVYKK